MLSTVSEEQWAQFSVLIADALGLDFPRRRRVNIQRRLARAAQEFGYDDVAACVDWLLSAPLTEAQLDVLVAHLTVGETYFFREEKAFEAVAHMLLPALIRARRHRDQTLRLWSAGCCTGEEAYSLAILLRQTIPDLKNWNVTILATDVNAHFLRAAAAASYGQRSFRNLPDGFKEEHFTRNDCGRYVVNPEIREMVTFAQLNLVEDLYPAAATGTNRMDLILCRNVLTYFTPEQTRKVVGKLHRSLSKGGWLTVSPSEASPERFHRFVTLDFDGVYMFEKGDPTRGTRVSVLAPAPYAPPPAPEPAAPEPASQTNAAYQLIQADAGPSPYAMAISLLARMLANQGRLGPALTWCDLWLAADRLDAAGHYLRAVVLLERDEPSRARRSLGRATHLRPDFVLAEFALGNLERKSGRSGDADKHFANALRLLDDHQPSDLLAESDGLTAGQLTETIRVLTASGVS